MDLSNKNEVEKLVKGCADGNRESQKLLYENMYGKMMAVCYRYSQRRDEAEDLFQDGFIKVFEKIHKYNFKGSLEGWIRRIMVNNAIDYLRIKKRKYNFTENTNEFVDVEDEVENTKMYEAISTQTILEMVQKLSASYQLVFNMYVLDGYTHQEIAEKLEISEGTSKSNLSKAKANLRMMVKEYLKNEEQ